MRTSLREYFYSRRTIWNIIDLASSMLIIAFGVIILGDFRSWLSSRYSCRIHKLLALDQTTLLHEIIQTHFLFIRMIIEMFKDIWTFLLIFFISIFAFANFYYILDKGNKTRILEDWNSSYTGAVIYTYMQALGELGNDEI